MNSLIPATALPSSPSSTASATVSTQGLNDHDAILTSWLPLTTVYPSLSGCAYFIVVSEDEGYVAWDPIQFFFQPNSTCQPLQVTEWWEWVQSSITTTQLSIGPITCPAAYTTVTTFVNLQNSTCVTCCPRYVIYTYKKKETLNNSVNSNYDYDPVQAECMSTAQSGQVLWVADDIGTGSEFPYYILTITTTQAIKGFQITGWLFPSDEALVSSSSSDISTASTTTTITSSSSLSQPAPGPSSGLSVGAQAGIGIGAGIVGITIGAGLAAFLFWRRRRKQRRAAAAMGDGGGGDSDEGMTEAKIYHPAAELPDQRKPTELSGQRDPVELPDQLRGPSELP